MNLALREPIQLTGDLNQLLLDTHRFGRMRVSRFSNGWYACIEMNTNTTGTAFEVKSNHDHATPLEAVGECICRMNAALKALSDV